MRKAPSVGSEKFTNDFLESLRSDGDPHADDCVEQFFDVELDSPATGLMEAMIKHAPSSDEASKTLGAFVNERPELPDWADPDLLKHAQDLFLEYVPQFGLGLWMASIPAGYAGARDVLALQRAGELVSHAKRRFMETGQFVLDVMTHGGLDTDGAGAADIRHVRLMHGAVRHMLVHEANDIGVPPWDLSTGVPLNQEALLATQFTFSVVGIQSVERLGVHLSAEDKDAYTHAWSIIGHLMGVRDDLLPFNYEDSATVWKRIQHKEYKKSDAGEELMAAALEVMKELVPGRIADGTPASGVRFLLGKKTSDILNVPRSNWTRVIFLPGQMLGSVMARFNRDSGFGRWISERLGRAIFTNFLELERDGERPTFSLPEQVSRRLGIDPKR